jgi:hypothetical protein
MIAPPRRARKGAWKCRDDALMTKLPETVGIRKIISEPRRNAAAFVGKFHNDARFRTTVRRVGLG